MKRSVALLAAAALFIAACGDSTNDEATSSEEEASAETSSADAGEDAGADVDTTDVDTTEADEGDNDTSAVTLGEPDWSRLEKRVIASLGGMSVGVADPQVIHYDANHLEVRSEFAPERGSNQPRMVLSLITQYADEAVIENIETLIAGMTAFGTAESTGEVLSAFGLEMEQWSFVGGELAEDGPGPVLSAYPRGTSGPTAWSPFPVSELYLANVDGGGVLAFGWMAPTEAELGTAQAVFEQVAPSIELASLDFADIGTVAGPIAASVPPENPPAPVALPADWDSPLTDIHTAVDVGTYTTAMLGTPARFTIDGTDWRVEPNFPALFVLAGPESIGVADRDLAFRTGVTEVVPVNGGYEAAGDGIDFTDLRALAEDPPPNMQIELSDVEVAGLPAIQADIEIVPSGMCDGSEICEYIILSRYAWPGHSLKAGYTNRVLYMDEGLDEPLVITMSGQDEAWLDVAQPVIDSLEFQRAGE